MRRWILTAASGFALAGAVAIGPLGAAAAAPYVYGCAPAQLYTAIAYTAVITIYNGSTATAHLTHKFLAGNGTILNPNPAGLPLALTSTLPATKTLQGTYGAPGTFGGDQGPALASVRIVSDVPVAASLTHYPTNYGPVIGVCLPLLP